MVNIKSKAQSWSLDIALGVIIFMGAFFLFYSVLNADQNTKARALKDEATTVIKQIASRDGLLRVVDNNEVNELKLNQLKNISYEELKRQLRIQGDFCIYLEDEKGNLMLINNSYMGIGASSIYLNNTPCSQK